MPKITKQCRICESYAEKTVASFFLDMVYSFVSICYSVCTMSILYGVFFKSLLPK